MISLHILMRLLRAQHENGSWSNTSEVTSYGILALSSLSKLPWVQQLDTSRIVSTIERGKSFLHSKRSEWKTGQYLWIEKVTYGSSVLSEAYCLAAALVPIPSTAQAHLDTDTVHAFLVPERLLLGMRKTGNLLARTPLFAETAPWSLRAAEMQACFAMQALQRQPQHIFPRTATNEDKYMFIIPLALTACAEAHGCPVSLSVMYEMMVLSVLNFHVDEYMEGVVERHFAANLDAIRDVVKGIFREIHPGGHNQPNGSAGGLNGHNMKPTKPVRPDPAGLGESVAGRKRLRNGLPVPNGNTEAANQGERAVPTSEDVKSVLSRYVRHILHHPAVLSSPAQLQTQLVSELQSFLLAHITQAEDNHRLRTGRAPNNGNNNKSSSNGHLVTTGNSDDPIPSRAASQPPTPSRTFYNWVRSTSADHTSCPFSFVFFTCLVHASSSSSSASANNRQTCPLHNNYYYYYPSARTAYLAEDLCRHLATLCRMYNDLGSVRRDAEEGTLNSVDFPEFSVGKDLKAEGDDDEKKKKKKEKKKGRRSCCGLRSMRGRSWRWRWRSWRRSWEVRWG
ncbi:hypothetical protein VTK56DRAFT_8569 [Thermocarpiscus australiensis]